jgi:glycerol uptake facilitator-like aquaporin
MNPKPTLTAELIAEFLGTFVLILFGLGVVAMVVLFPTNNPGETIHGGFTNITLGWGLAVTMGIYIAGKISGAHLNPAVTLALAVFRGFSWRKVLPFCIAQTAAAFAAAAVVYWNYLPAFRTPRESSLHFRPSQPSRKPDSSINLSALACWCFSSSRLPTNTIRRQDRTLRP